MRSDQPNALTESEALYRLNDLNKEMLRLPIEERRKHWKDYYARLGELRNPSSETREHTPSV